MWRVCGGLTENQNTVRVLNGYSPRRELARREAGIVVPGVNSEGCWRRRRRLVIRLYIKELIRCLGRRWYAATDRFCLQEPEVVVARIDEVILVERMVLGCAQFSSLLLYLTLALTGYRMRLCEEYMSEFARDALTSSNHPDWPLRF